MNDAFEILRRLEKYIGWHAFVLIAFSLIALFFAKDVEKFGGLQTSVLAVAGALFATGLLVGLLRAFASVFAHRPPRGLVDGLVCGALSGAIGGYLGYGFHASPSYVDPTLTRVVLCIIFATPVGGVLGVCFDLFHSDRPINWRTYAGVILLSFLCILAIAGFFIFRFAPTVSGHGINLSDLQLLFEGYVVLLATLASFEFGWRFRRVLLQSVFLIAGIALGRVLTFAIPYTASPDSTCTHLGCYEFVDETIGRENAALAVIVLMLWATVTYGLFSRVNLSRSDVSA